MAVRIFLNDRKHKIFKFLGYIDDSFWPYIEPLGNKYMIGNIDPYDFMFLNKIQLTLLEQEIITLSNDNKIPNELKMIFLNSIREFHQNNAYFLEFWGD